MASVSSNLGCLTELNLGDLVAWRGFMIEEEEQEASWAVSFLSLERVTILSEVEMVKLALGEVTLLALGDLLGEDSELIDLLPVLLLLAPEKVLIAGQQSE